MPVEMMVMMVVMVRAQEPVQDHKQNRHEVGEDNRDDL